MESPATPSVVTSFALIIDGLLAAIAARIADYPFTSEMVTFLWNRVNIVRNRFLALAARIQAGKVPRERGAKPRARKRPGTEKPPGINWRKWLPMGRFAWLCWLMPSLANRFGAAQFGEQLRHLLGQPGMRALLAATPKAGRLLAPLCFMMGIEDSLLRPVIPPAPPPPASTAEILPPEPDAAPVKIDSAPPPSDEAPPRAPDPPAEPSVGFFVSA
jgi:hypothetical protein